MSCHQLEGVGGNVGPDLTRVWDTHSVDKVMEAILEPSKEIKEGYQNYVATTTGGQIHTGLRISQTPEAVVIREANGKEVRIAAKDLDTLVVSKKSLMPDDVVKHLTFGQFLDLVAFLKDRKAQEALRGLALEYWVVGPFSPDLRKPAAPEANPKLEVQYEPDQGVGLAGKKLSWQTQQTDSLGYLDLPAVLGKHKGAMFAQSFVYSSVAQDITLLPGNSGKLRIWVNGKQVLEAFGKSGIQAETLGLAVRLNPGWNSVLVRATQGDGPGLYLRFAGTGLRLSLRPEQK